MDMNNDFGFTLHDEEEDNRLELLNEADELKKRLLRVEALMLPLLDNLLKDPDKPVIKWKNREKVVKQLRQQLLDLTKYEM